MSSEWIAAIAALWAAVATTWAAIATLKAVAATKKAPFDAAHLAASAQSATEKVRAKMWVFATIMQNRHFIAEPECVKALNLIDTVFHDVPSVRDAWAHLFSALNDPRNFPATGPTPLIDHRRTELLVSIARDVDLDFRPDDFGRVYLPQPILSTILQLRDLQRRSALNAMLAQPPPAPLLTLPGGTWRFGLRVGMPETNS